MAFLDLAEARYSCRKFADKEIEQEKIDKILRAGQVAPTARNNQPQKILAIKSAGALEKWRKCTVCHFGETLVLLVCSDSSQVWKREYDGKTSGDVDASIVTTHMMLQAQELGIGSTWVMFFNPETAREQFDLPENLEPIAALLMGYPAEDAEPSPRHAEMKPLEETVLYL